MEKLDVADGNQPLASTSANTETPNKPTDSSNDTSMSSKSLKPVPPKEARATSPAPVPDLDNLNIPLLDKYIKTWNVSESNFEQRMAEYTFTLRRLSTQTVEDLLMKSAKYKMEA